jgi:ribosomal protein S18 acetylase RimI-like enzyme
VGVALLRHASPTTEPSLLAVHVSKEYQRKGIGLALTERSVARLMSRSDRSILVEVVNPHAMAMIRQLPPRLLARLNVVEVQAPEGMVF